MRSERETPILKLRGCHEILNTFLPPTLHHSLYASIPSFDLSLQGVLHTLTPSLPPFLPTSFSVYLSLTYHILCLPLCFLYSFPPFPHSLFSLLLSASLTVSFPLPYSFLVFLPARK